MIKCIIPCIYYREIFDKSKNPTCKIICDRNGEELKNSGVSTHFNYLSKNDVSFYHDNGLYVLAYPADRLDVAARLCEYGVNGITSNEGKILKLLASNPQI